MFSVHECFVFQASACSETTLLEGAAGGSHRGAPIPRGLNIQKGKKKEEEGVASNEKPSQECDLESQASESKESNKSFS